MGRKVDKLLLESQAKKEDINSLFNYWREKKELNWPSPFTTPPFIKAWWENLGSEAGLFLRSFWEEEKLLGLAPLVIKEGCVFPAGSGEVCDYQDFTINKAREENYFTALLSELKREKINSMQVISMRADSPSFLSLKRASLAMGAEISCYPQEVILERELPSSWEDYLYLLSKKQRHEVRRKVRRLEEAGEVEYLVLKEPSEVIDFLPRFLKLFKNSRVDKSRFLTHGRENFFYSLLSFMAVEGMAKLGVLKIAGEYAAVVACFDYGNTVYLYNSGYQTSFSHLSPGLLSKVFMIKHSIELGRRYFNFLKGGEEYKYRLGGVEVPTYRLQFRL